MAAFLLVTRFPFKTNRNGVPSKRPTHMMTTCALCTHRLDGCAYDLPIFGFIYGTHGPWPSNCLYVQACPRLKVSCALENACLCKRRQTTKNDMQCESMNKRGWVRACVGGVGGWVSVCVCGCGRGFHCSCGTLDNRKRHAAKVPKDTPCATIRMM